MQIYFKKKRTENRLCDALQIQDYEKIVLSKEYLSLIKNLVGETFDHVEESEVDSKGSLVNVEECKNVN